MATTNLDKLEQFLTRMDSTTLSKEEFTSAFQKVVDFVIKIEKKQNQEIEVLRQAVQQVLAKLESKFDVSLKGLEQKFNDAGVKDVLVKMESKHKEMLVMADTKVKSLKHGKDGNPGPRGEPGMKGDPGAISLELVAKAMKQPMEEFTKNWDDKVQALIASKRMAGGTPHNLLNTISVSSQADGFNRVFTGLPTARFYPFVALSGQNPVMLIAGTHYSIGNRSITILNNTEPPQNNVEVTVFYIK